MPQAATLMHAGEQWEGLKSLDQRGERRRWTAREHLRQHALPLALALALPLPLPHPLPLPYPQSQPQP